MAAEEKRKISERTKEGLRRAKAQGQTLGRPSKIDPSIVAEIIAMRQEDAMSTGSCSIGTCSTGSAARPSRPSLRGSAKSSWQPWFGSNPGKAQTGC